MCTNLNKQVKNNDLPEYSVRIFTLWCLYFWHIKTTYGCPVPAYLCVNRIKIHCTVTGWFDVQLYNCTPVQLTQEYLYSLFSAQLCNHKKIKRTFVDASVLQWGQIKTCKLHLSICNTSLHVLYIQYLRGICYYPQRQYKMCVDVGPSYVVV